MPAPIVRYLDSPAPADLTFAPDQHVHWADATSGLHFGGWQVGAHHLGIGSHWEVRPSGVTAFSGHVWLDTEPWKPGGSWAAQLADRVADVDATALARRLDGVGNLVRLTTDGRGAIVGDPLGVGLTYVGHTDDVTVFSNRAAVVARLIAPAGHEPARDVEGVVELAYASNLQSDRTTFVGVAPVPRTSVVELTPGAHPETVQWAHQPWIDPGLADAAATPEIFGPAIDHLRSLTRVVAAVPCFQGTLELTGGRDSRMILGLLLAEEVAHDFSYVTWGSADLPDVIVANQLADRFGLDLRAEGRPRPRPRTPRARRPEGPGALGPDAPTEDRAPEPLDWDGQLRRHVWRTSGAVSIWDLARNSRTPSPNTALTGQFGELLRTNYPRTTGIASMRDLDRYLTDGEFGFDAARILRPDARRHHDDLVATQLREVLPPGGTAQDAIDGFNQVARLRRWFGSAHELDNRNRLFPLYSLPAIRVAFAIGSRRRRLEELPFEILQATSPDLATMPFAQKAWPESLVADRADRHRYPTSPDEERWVPARRATRRAGRRPDRSRRAAPSLVTEQRTMHDIEAKIPVLREHLDLGPDHELYRHLDYDATMRAVAMLPELDYLARRSVHDAVTAAMWLSGAETPETF